MKLYLYTNGFIFFFKTFFELANRLNLDIISFRFCAVKFNLLLDPKPLPQGSVSDNPTRDRDRESRLLRGCRNPSANRPGWEGCGRGQEYPKVGVVHPAGLAPPGCHF